MRYTPTLQHSNTPTLHHSITPTLHHSNTPSLHHSITPMLKPSTMRSWFTIALMAQLFGAAFATADTAEVTESELMQVATTLARQYDAGYAAKDPAGVAALYATDGVLVSPAGPIVRGREALTAYYTK